MYPLKIKGYEKNFYIASYCAIFITIQITPKKYRFMEYCLYYQASIRKELVWFATATFRFVEHVVFDRTIDKDKSVFEFFVAPDLQDVFLHMMDKLQKKEVVTKLQQLPNRLQE